MLPAADAKSFFKTLIVFFDLVFNSVILNKPNTPGLQVPSMKFKSETHYMRLPNQLI